MHGGNVPAHIGLRFFFCKGAVCSREHYVVCSKVRLIGHEIFGLEIEDTYTPAERRRTFLAIDSMDKAYVLRRLVFLHVIYKLQNNLRHLKRQAIDNNDKDYLSAAHSIWEHGLKGHPIAKRFRTLLHRNIVHRAWKEPLEVAGIWPAALGGA